MAISKRRRARQGARAMSTARDRPPEEAQEDTSFARGLRVLLGGGACEGALRGCAPRETGEGVVSLEPIPGASIPDPDRLRADLADIVTSGVARSVGEVVSGSVAIAAPIFREDGIVAAIGVTGPEGRCGLAWRTRVARLLPGAANSVVGALGAGLLGQDSRHPE